MFNRFDTIPACDEQTDRESDGRTSRRTHDDNARAENARLENAGLENSEQETYGTPRVA